MQTDWDQIRAAESSHEVLRLLVERYTRKLWTHAKWQWRNLNATDLEDFVQSFLLKLLTGKVFAAADPSRGRFRTYFLRCFDNHVRDLLKSTRHVADLGELELAIGESGALWAEELFRVAADAMQRECLAEGNQRLWGIASDRFIEPILSGAPPVSYEQIARQHNLKETNSVAGAVRSARKKLVSCIRETIATYAQDEADIEAEISELIANLPQHLRETSSVMTTSEFLYSYWQYDLQQFSNESGNKDSVVPLADAGTATYLQLILSDRPPFAALLAVRDMAKSWMRQRDPGVPVAARKVLYYGLSANSRVLFDRRITSLTERQLMVCLQQTLDQHAAELPLAVTERLGQIIVQLGGSLGTPRPASVSP